MKLKHQTANYQSYRKSRSKESKTQKAKLTKLQVAAGQLDLYNYKLAELAHELDKVDVNQLTPIEALNILVNMKEKMK